MQTFWQSNYVLKWCSTPSQYVVGGMESAYLPSMENNIMAGTANLAVMIVETALMVQHQWTPFPLGA